MSCHGTEDNHKKKTNKKKKRKTNVRVFRMGEYSQNGIYSSTTERHEDILVRTWSWITI
ncbi:hypothetical protein FKM82_006456 [Ascaphus truei]